MPTSVEVVRKAHTHMFNMNNNQSGNAMHRAYIVIHFLG